jgi:glycerol-3-phosphate O-acyltransferase
MYSLETAWPDEQHSNVVFLIEGNNRLQTRVLKRWIDATNSDQREYDTIVFTKGSRTQMANSLKALYDLPDDTYLVPLRTLWFSKKASQRTSLQESLKWRHLIFGDPRTPGNWRQSMIHMLDPQRCKPLSAEGATFKDLKQRFEMAHPEAGNAPDLLVDYVGRQAMLTLERAERLIRGVRYKIPALVAEEVLSKPNLVKKLVDESERSLKPMDSLMTYAGKCLTEVAARPTSLAVDTLASLGRYLYTRGFDPEIEMQEEDVKRVRQLVSERPVVFLMTHRSHLDGFLMTTLFYDMNLPPLHTFGGINMNFFGFGTLFRRGGAIFIRRSFEGDRVYKSVFSQYIEYLVEKRFPLLWALEGTRSRTGKMMPPRYGLIRYVVDAAKRNENADVLFVPVSIVYDQVPEVKDYGNLQSGGKKRPESASWFMQYISGLKNPFGKIHVKFGQGVAMSDVTQGTKEMSTLEIQKLAFQLSVDANNATAVAPTSIITYVLLIQGTRALTQNELVTEISSLLELLRRLNYPLTADADLSQPEVLSKVLDQLTQTGVIVTYKDGPEPVYAVAPESVRTAAYYRNGMIHFLVVGAIADLALLHLAEQPQFSSRDQALDAMREEALRIRDLMKFEFFFAEKEAFIEQLEDELTRRVGETDWRNLLTAGRQEIRALLWRINPLLAHGALRPFVESYHLAAEAAVTELQAEPNEVPDKGTIANSALSLGKQRVLQQRINCEESVSQTYIDNGLKLLESKGCLNGSRLQQLEHCNVALQELSALVRRIEFVASLAESRRTRKSPEYLDTAVATEAHDYNNNQLDKAV